VILKVDSRKDWMNLEHLIAQWRDLDLELNILWYCDWWDVFFILVDKLKV